MEKYVALIIVHSVVIRLYFEAGPFLCATITCVKYFMVRMPVLTCSLESHKMKSADIADTGTIYFLYTMLL